MLAEALGIKPPGVVACVGAGGKTSLLQSLAAAKAVWPVVLTSTTKMFYEQVARYPLVVEDECDAGIQGVSRALATGRPTAWFSRQESDKVVGVPAEWIDELAAALPAVTIVVEADGARRCLLKAPAQWEPVVPATTSTTVGLINLRSLGQPLLPDNTHRLELVTRIINKQQGEIITWQDIAKLAIHPQGIFQYARGNKALLLSGSDNGGAYREDIKQIAGFIKTAAAGIERLVVSAGYGSGMQAVEVYVL